MSRAEVKRLSRHTESSVSMLVVHSSWFMQLPWPLAGHQSVGLSVSLLRACYLWPIEWIWVVAMATASRGVKGWSVFFFFFLRGGRKQLNTGNLYQKWRRLDSLYLLPAHVWNKDPTQLIILWYSEQCFSATEISYILPEALTDSNL